MKGVNILKKCQQPKKKTKYEFHDQDKSMCDVMCAIVLRETSCLHRKGRVVQILVCVVQMCVCVFVPLHLWWEDFLLASPDLETPGANRVY